LAPGRVAPRGRSRNPGRPARPIPRGNARCAAVPTAEAVDLAISLAADASNVDTFAASSMADALSDTGIPEWQIYYGFIAGLSPFVIAAYEFGKRILIQRQCELCGGSGLIQKGRYSRKCTSCGGFLPWQSWELFFTSEAGNGSRVNAPKGQTSVFYDVDAAKKDSVEQAERARQREAAAGAAKAAVKPSTLASIDFDDDMFVGADTGAPEPVMQTCDEDDQAAMENVLFGFGAAEEEANEEEDEEASEPADAPTRPSTLASMDLDDGAWMNADLSVGKPPAPEPVMQTCDEDDQEAMESALSAISGGARKEEEEVRRPSTLASMDFDDAMFVGADTAGPDPVMQTCDEDDQAAMESVLFRFNARNEIESVEEKRAPSTLASMDFDDDMFADAAGEDIPEPVMQTCDEDDQAAMESVLSTFGSKKDNSDDDDGDKGGGGGGRRDLLAGCVALFSGLALNAPAADAADIVDTGGYMSFEELEARARAAYRGKRLDEAKDLLTRIIGMEPEDGTWRERRAQVLVDLKQFEAAIEDFNAAENLYDSDYKSLGLLSNRALAHEGLSDWNGALKDYTECITLSREIGGVPPYVLNSRGNALSSLGRYDEALVDYDEAAKTFQVMHNLSGAIYARSNAALTLAELGREDDAIREMEAVARRAAGSIDMRAALAAMHWSRGEQDAAERDWNWACEKINSGVLTEGGPALDGCALYRDSDWLGRIRRWPPSMVTKMDDFIRLRKPTSA
jgi:hypothetical protein